MRVVSSRTASAIPTGWAETPVGLATSVLAADHEPERGDDQDGEGDELDEVDPTNDNLEPIVEVYLTSCHLTQMA